MCSAQDDEVNRILDEKQKLIAEILQVGQPASFSPVLLQGG